MTVDPRFGNSSGYFKDPVSGEDLSVDTPRVIECRLTEEGKFVWPCVLQSDGNQMLKIVYKLFTDEEKDLYKQYRGRSHSGTKPKHEPKPKEPVTHEQIQQETQVQVVTYDPESACTPETLAIIAMCDQCLGISNIGGLRYMLMSAKGSNKVYHIPRGLVPDSEYERLCNIS